MKPEEIVEYLQRNDKRILRELMEIIEKHDNAIYVIKEIMDTDKPILDKLAMAYSLGFMMAESIFIQRKVENGGVGYL